MRKWRAVKANRVNSPYDILGGDPDREDYESIIARHMTKEIADWIVEQHNSQTEPCTIFKGNTEYLTDGDILLGYELFCSNCQSSIEYENSPRKNNYCPSCGKLLEREASK